MTATESGPGGFIFAVVGPSGCGKSALIDEMLQRFPSTLAIMPSLTTRSRRPVDEDRSTRFVTRGEFLGLERSGSLIQWVEYDGNLYGDARADIEAIFASGRHGIRPLIETAVRSFRAKGYRAVMVKVVPIGKGFESRSKARQVIDAEREREALAPDIEIVNRFEDGGFAAACAQLQAFIRAKITDSGGHISEGAG